MRFDEGSRPGESKADGKRRRTLLDKRRIAVLVRRIHADERKRHAAALRLVNSRLPCYDDLPLGVKP